jgi:Lamin Tail Domain/FlgD Ig-like domain
MRLRLLLFSLFVQTVYAQITIFPSLENFDGVQSPFFPVGWSANGFSISASTPLSSPNCLLATGNTLIKQLTSQVFNFTDKIPDKLIYYERRSNTAAGYRMEVRASIDGINFNILLARFDTISTTTNYVQRIVSLYEAGLKQQSNVRIRWQLLGDNTNTTGVLRIDDVLLTVTTGFDIGISKMTAGPVTPTRKDSISLATVVKNYGALFSSNFSIHFFCNSNSDDVIETGEEFSAFHGLSLNPGDSMLCMITHVPMKAGAYRFMSAIDYPPDENHTNDTARTLIEVGNVKGDVLINEIMYFPIGDEPEWVELFNASSDTMNLKNWKISDSNISTKSIIAQHDVLFPPESFIVIAKDIIFASTHPGVPLVIADYSALNNSTSDAVVIYDTRSISIDSVMYVPSWGGQNGKSLERVDGEMSSTAPINWGTSQDSLGSTPGRKNSIARLEYDLKISNLTQIQSLIGGKLIPTVNVSVQNIGRRIADSVCVNFYSDKNHNSLPEPSECISHKISFQSLAAGDSILFSESFPQLASGATTIIIVVDWWRDECVRNNQASISIKLSCDPLAVVINEIMYDPLSNQNEWLEFFNRSDQPIDLSHWTFNDRPTVNTMNSFEIPCQPSAVKPGEFMVVAADSSVFKIFQSLSQSDSTVHIGILNHSSGFSLNNDGDAVVLKDLTGQTIDSVAYLPGWHHPDVVDTKGRSLERINPNIESNDPRNWSTCTNILGGTPGKVNSIMTLSRTSNSLVSISPNPFSPDGNGFEDFCIIRYTLPLMTSTLNVKIYDIKGRLVRTLANGELAGRQGELVWNGFDDNNQRARIGVYVIFLEATDRSSSKVVTAKAVAVVAAKL